MRHTVSTVYSANLHLRFIHFTNHHVNTVLLMIDHALGPMVEVIAELHVFLLSHRQRFEVEESGDD